ncbi:phosphotransferase [Serinicoccus chungangensis]|uniref:phosphotransferase n=1 Tax=Serinicoccus chungangensis TaxID=767452 RepID=UPI00137B7A2C|nr:phosphotransferase [Serinicoccus chungangensis]
MKRTDLALAALASAAVPGMKPVTVARMSVERGAETELEQAVVEDATGRRWLVRSPLTAVAGARLHRNDELVRQLARHLPFKVPAAAGYAAVGREGHAAVYPHVEGATLDFTRLPAGAGLAHAVGRAVAAVHNIPAGVFEEQDVPSFDAAGWRQRLIAEVDRAAETGRVPTRLLARWEEAFDASPLWQFASTPVHGSFRGATVVVTFADDGADSGRVVAVTDWDEAMVGDPATDLAEVYAQASPEAWESVLDSYALARAQRPDPYLHARARLLSETGRLRGLAQHVAAGDEESARRVVEVLRRMDRLTEDEDSLVPTTARAGGAALSAAAHPVPEGPSAPKGGPGPLAAEGDLPEPPEGEELDEEDDDLDSDEAVARPDPYLDDGDPDPHPDDESSGPGADPWSGADDGADDADITTEVPVVRPDDAPRPLADGPAPAVPQRPEEEGTPEGVDAPAPGGEPAEPPAAGPAGGTPLGEEPSGAPAQGAPEGGATPEPDQDAAPEHGATPEPDQDAASEDVELLDDDTRLHELYGMPSEEDQDR